MKPTASRACVAALAGVMVCSSLGAAEPAANSITVIHDHAPAKSKAEISKRGGLSMYVKVDGKTVLFDTGNEASPPVQNLEHLGLGPNPIDAVVLSHDQSDRVYGLHDVLSANAMKPKVYVPAPAAEGILRQNPRANVVAVSKPIGILSDAWLVGPMQLEYKGGTIAEQVLVLDQKDGLVVIVGCSHPDIVSAVEQVKEVFGYKKIKLIAGGFHLQGNSKNEIKDISLRLQQMGVKSFALSDCTGDSALKIFRKEWGVRLVSFNEGDNVGF